MFLLRKYQQKAVEELFDNLVALLERTDRRKKLVFKAPTGSGKTVTMASFLNTLSQELPTQTQLRHRNIAYIWIAPNELHIQSYEKIKQFFAELHTIRCIQFDDIVDNSLRKNDLLFLNWQSISNEKNLIIRENEQNRNLQEILNATRNSGVEIITVLDEAHLFAAKGQKANKVLALLNSLVEIDVSATPFFHTDFMVTIRRDQVVKAGMIKKGVFLNTGFDDATSADVTLNEMLLEEALDQRSRIASSYKEIGEEINPLLLIQLPSETLKSTREDENIRSMVINWLHSKGINVDNGKLAIWLSNEKQNLENIEDHNSITEVLLFKQAIALGWDCPRAAVLLIYREIKQETFTVQTVGRILRMPQLKHYETDLHDYGFVYTNLSKDIIKIVADDMEYIVENKAVRREGYQGLQLLSFHINRKPHRNRLSSKFRRFLNKAAEDMFGISMGLFDDTPPQERNCEIMKNKFIEMDVKKIEITIPKNVFIEGDDIANLSLTGLNIEKYARTGDEIILIYEKFLRDNLGDFAKHDSAPILKVALAEFFEEYLGVYEIEARKIVLFDANRKQFEGLIKLALETFAASIAASKAAATMEVQTYCWDVPEFKLYNDKYAQFPAKGSIHQPLFLYRRGDNLFADSDTEFEFINFLEKNLDHIDWWYKNGVGNKSDFSVSYENSDNQTGLFYVDFVIQFKSGVTGLFDTKTKGSDPEVVNKQKALFNYIQDENKKGRSLIGGIIVPDGNNWRYPKSLINNTDDVSGWNLFFPDRIK